MSKQTPNKFRGQYQVADGYAGGSRPQYFTFYEEDLDDDITDAELEDLYEQAMEDHFREHITPNAERVDEFIAWARDRIAASKAEGGTE